MRKIRITIAACVLAVAGLTAFAPPASACLSDVCTHINTVCRKVTKGYDCVG